MTDRSDLHDQHTMLETVTCASCGVLFAVPELLADARRDTGEPFYCPSGHSIAFTSTRRRLERQLAAERRRSGRLAAERDQIDARLRARLDPVRPLRERIAVCIAACRRPLRGAGRNAAVEPAD